MRDNSKQLKTFFLTGKPRSGKSFLVNELVRILQGQGLKVGGILTPDIRESHERTGFYIIDIFTNLKEILASKHRKKGPRQGKYRINVDGINCITEKFLENLDDFDIIVIDELGVMELHSKTFKKMLDQIFQSPQPKLIVINRHLVKFYETYGEVIEMKRKIADKIKEKLLKNFIS